jgi:general secretion pathway protein D
MILRLVVLFFFIFGIFSEQKLTASDLVSIHFPEPTPIKNLVQAVALWTQKTIHMESPFQETIQIVAPKKVSPQEAYHIFLSALDQVGLTAVETGSTMKIIKKTNGIKYAIPMSLERSSTGFSPSHRLVTRVFSPIYVSSEDIQKSLSQIFPGTRFSAQAHLLIAMDTEHMIHRIEQILKILDENTNERILKSIQLFNSDAKIIEKIIKDFYIKNLSIKNDIASVFSNESANKIFIYASKKRIDEAFEIVKKMDTPSLENSKIQPKDIYLIPIYFSDSKNLVSLISQIRGDQKEEDFSISADESTNSILLRGSYEAYQKTLNLVKKIDQPKDQVFFRVHVVEFFSEDFYKFVSSFLGGSKLGAYQQVSAWQASNVAPMVLGASQNQTQSSVQLAASTFQEDLTISLIPSKEVSLPGLGKISPQLLLKTIKTDSRAQSLSSPYLFTTNHQEASLSLGTVLYFSTAESDPLGMVTQKIQKENVDLSLTLTPHVSGRDLSLKIVLDVNDISGFNPKNMPILVKRKTSQTVLLRDREVAVLSGLEKESINQEISKVPLLGDLPLLGLFFRNSRDRSQKTKILIQITPYILKKGQDPKNIYQDQMAHDMGSESFLYNNMRDLHKGEEP